MNSDRVWHARWIKPGAMPQDTAPVFQKQFTLDSVPADATVYVSGMGFYVMQINGQRVGDELLTPAFSAYDRTVYYNVKPVAALLQPGENRVEITLGNGWYHENAANAWEFEHAAWRAAPQLIFELTGDGRTLLSSDTTWQWATSRTTYNSLRYGETWDDTAEIGPWQQALISHGPGGVLKEQRTPPIRLQEELLPVTVTPWGEGVVYDFGVNLSGNVEITVQGRRGDRVTLKYFEVQEKGGVPEKEDITNCTYSDRFQEDVYILSGEEEETWHSEFGYNGFRYVYATDHTVIREMTARCFHTDLKDAGGMETDFEPLMRLHNAARRSTLTNFHHIPTDCPHRDKNGWTGDAHLSSPQALMNFHMKQAYLKYLDDLADGQRPNGAVSCISPTSIWGYEWGTGTTWDYVIFELPWQVYRYTRDADVLRRYQPMMARYLAFLEGMQENDIFPDGLGDWCPPETEGYIKCPDAALLTAYAREMHRTYARVCRVLGMDEQASASEKRAEEIRSAFLRAFPEGEGEGQTLLALRLAFDLTENRQDALRRLTERVTADGERLYVGIFGAKHIFRALTDGGRFDLAWRMLWQEGFPGYPHMLDLCSGTLGECWDGKNSQNHHMYSDVDAWLYEDVAGMLLCDDGTVTVAPHIPEDVAHFSAWHDLPDGRMTVAWDREVLRVSLPAGRRATLRDAQGAEETITGEGAWPRARFEVKTKD